MKVLILGGTGYLGPHVVKALGPHHELLVTDINPPKMEMQHEFRRVDVTSREQVIEAAKNMDAIINLSVVRQDRQLAFDVNTRGCRHVMLAAVTHGIRRVINTGPHFTLAGPPYERFDFGISPDGPYKSGTSLYALSKSLGQEICRVFSRRHDVYVQDYLFLSFRDPAELKPGAGGRPVMVSWADAAEVYRLGLEIDLAKLPSRCEVFFVLSDMPHGKYLNDKTKRILGFAPKDDISALWRRAD